MLDTKVTISAPSAMERSAEEGDEKERVHDSSVDYKGRIPRRSATGGWRASLFIIGIEFSERLSYYGIASNLIIYLNKVLHQDLKTAAKNVNDWVGVTTVVPLVGGFLADAYVGRFWMVLISSIVYLLGLSLLTLSELVPSLKPPPCSSSTSGSSAYYTCTKSLRTHKLAFFLALYLISLGTGGHKPSLESFGADQFDDNDDDERRKKVSFFNWWYFGLCSGVVLGVTLIVYVQDYVSWGAGFGVLAATTALAIVVLGFGVPFYRYRVPQGSTLTPMVQVLVAAMAKRKLPYPSDPSELHELETVPGRRRLRHTNRMRFLDKAAIVDQEALESSPAAANKGCHHLWRMATVTQVEETKQLLSMVPIWLCTLTFGVCISQGQTFFIKQGNLTNRYLTPHFQIPPASLLAFSASTMIIFVSFYDRLLVPFLRSLTGLDRGITVLQRIGTGMAICIATMTAAALAEKKRRDSDHVISVIWLVPQFVLLGVADVFTLVGLQEYFYDQVPDSMRSLGIAFYLSVVGVSSFISSLLITVVDSVTGRGGRKSWFGVDLNSSRLDYFYWLLAGLCAMNLCLYVLVARKYVYKTVERVQRGAVGDAIDEGGGGGRELRVIA
ncbi:protein NRT1/ PTR FAMILY 5.6-like [Nymphaea colorata]|nr:protein NRT1/ PTR FAMILY 5.6-like [Nymphaea colorata]